MAALMSSEIDKTDSLVEHVDDCHRMDIEVKPPDINQGEVNFTVVDGIIRFGLVAIKGAGEKAIQSIVRQRDKKGPYKSIFDFCERIDSSVVNRACVESLIKTGAFDSLGARRAQLMEALPTALAAGSTARQGSGQRAGTPLRRFRRRDPRRGPMRLYPTFPSGPTRRSSATRRRSWGSTFRAIPWPSTRTSCGSSVRTRSATWANCPAAPRSFSAA